MELKVLPAPSNRPKLPRAAPLAALLLALLLLSIRLASRRGDVARPGVPDGRAGGGGDGAAAAAWPVTSDLSKWIQLPHAYSFQPPQSKCLLHPDGRVDLAPGYDAPERPSFLFDTASMPDEKTACPHCDPNENPLLCCGVCIFERRRCDKFYPGQRRSEAVEQHLLDNGHRLKDLSPCELFARIRGRTLWFMGDSQTWHYYYSAECFLREFAPNLRRTPAVSPEDNPKLITVTWPVSVPPLCLQLALGTRVCAVRVDSAEVLYQTVLPLLQRLVPGFKDDLMIFDTGLHYPTPGDGGQPLNASELYRHMAALSDWRQQHAAELPKLVWMDAPVQHFTGPDGTYDGGKKPFRCAPLRAWYAGDAVTLAGGRRNVALAPLIPQLADAHLRTWNASVPLWATHKPEECTHWCSPSAYHLWLYLLNTVMRDASLGGSVSVRQRAAEGAAAEAAVVAAADEAAAAGAGAGLHLHAVEEPGA